MVSGSSSLLFSGSSARPHFIFSNVHVLFLSASWRQPFFLAFPVKISTFFFIFFLKNFVFFSVGQLKAAPFFSPPSTMCCFLVFSFFLFFSPFWGFFSPFRTRRFSYTVPCPASRLSRIHAKAPNKVRGLKAGSSRRLNPKLVKKRCLEYPWRGLAFGQCFSQWKVGVEIKNF